MNAFEKWNQEKLSRLVRNLERKISADDLAETKDGLNVASRQKVYQVLDQLLAVLFPGVLGDEAVAEKGLRLFLEEHMRGLMPALQEQIEKILNFVSRRTKRNPAQNARKSCQIVVDFVEKLPEIRKNLLTDIEAAYEGDPAAVSLSEVLLSYPCIEAIATYRLAHELYLAKVPVIPRIMTERAHSRTGIDIHPGATIDTYFFIDHGTGVVIGETCVIGKGVKLYQGVTLGALSFPKDEKGRLIKGVKRHPDIEDNVVIYAGATVLGGDTVIGKNAIIGGNCWVTSSVPANTIVRSETSRSKIKSVRKK